MSCRVCLSETDAKGLLHCCSKKTCNAVHWDKFAVKRLVKENKETSQEASPDWLQTLLKEADVPESVAGEHYVYIIKLRKNLPKNMSAKWKEKLPNSGNGRFYVGMTGLHPYARYLNHVRGYKAPWATKRMAVAMVGFEGPMSYTDAKALEPVKAQELRERGYDVHGGH